jgi:hypothetical protein
MRRLAQVAALNLKWVAGKWGVQPHIRPRKCEPRDIEVASSQFFRQTYPQKKKSFIRSLGHNSPWYTTVHVTCGILRTTTVCNKSSDWSIYHHVSEWYFGKNESTIYETHLRKNASNLSFS